MNVKIFTHSLASCWNHGNAHFLRGVASDMVSRGWNVEIFEPRDSWSAMNLQEDGGKLNDYRSFYSEIKSEFYDSDHLDLNRWLDNADLVLVHEWNEHSLVASIGDHAKGNGGYQLWFHDTHHRSITEPDSMSAYDLSGYDGVLAFGEIISDIYRKNGWAKRAVTWHEAADTKRFFPHNLSLEGDVVWIGNWGDGERTAELEEFLFKPIADLGLKAAVYGVRYPTEAIDRLEKAGIEYRGWLPNYRAPEVFGRYRMTVHVPRGPYVKALPGIPTIRPFEALACGIPLLSAPWNDSEHLFNGDLDYATASNGEEMKELMREVLAGDAVVESRKKHGLSTIRDQHTCAIRVDQLISDGVAVLKREEVLN